MIYLDNAATTMQKPPEVLRAVKNAFTSFGGPGRGSHKAAMRAAEAMYTCREAACELFGVKSPERVILTLNATHALNTSIKSLAQPGGKVLVSGFEHNAVMRPLHTLKDVDYTVVETPLFDPDGTYNAFENALDDSVTLVVCNHVSNVFGYILPVERIADLCAEKGVPFIVDASQSAGSLSVSAERLNKAVICMPGHKGLYGPQGTGLMIIPENTDINTLIEGGTGSNSLSLSMPGDLPDALEAGTPNAWGAAGLCEGIRYVLRTGTEKILEDELELLEYAGGLIGNIKGVSRFHSPECQGGVMSLVFDNADAEDIAALLSEKDIAVRAGLHCAPVAHKTAGTLPYGTLRISFSSFTSRRDITVFASALNAILNK